MCLVAKAAAEAVLCPDGTVPSWPEGHEGPLFVGLKLMCVPCRGAAPASGPSSSQHQPCLRSAERHVPRLPLPRLEPELRGHRHHVCFGWAGLGLRAAPGAGLCCAWSTARLVPGGQSAAPPPPCPPDLQVWLHRHLPGC